MGNATLNVGSLAQKLNLQDMISNGFFITSQKPADLILTIGWGGNR
jgi:uncharacterized lipoprotein YajG